MAAFLTFALAAPLGSMGGLAVGERRGTSDRPARSAILGLVAGCLGIVRTDGAAHDSLAAGLGVAVRRLGPPGALLADFHTAQTTRTQRKRVFDTRREELSQPRETILTRRDHRCDLAFTVALWLRGAPSAWTLEDLADALRRPDFTPYLGRKSCPLGLPMAPLVAKAETLRGALMARDAAMTELERAAIGRGAGTVWSDEPSGSEPPLGLHGPTRTEVRRDEPISRVRWQFALRREVAADWPSA